MKDFLVELSRLAALYLLYWPVESLLTRAYQLAPESYARPFVVGELLLHFAPYSRETGVAPELVVAWLGGLALGWFGRRTLFARWSELDELRDLRLVGVAMIVSVAWAFSTLEYNLYFDQGHLLDRALLVLCGVGAVVRPIFIAPLVGLGLALMGQLQHPLGGFGTTHYVLAFNGLMLFLAALIARTVRVRLRPWQVLAALMTLVAAGYFRSGTDKLWLWWPVNEDVANLLFATYANGWLGFLSHDEVAAIGRVLSSLNPLMIAWTLAQELGMLLVLWSRRTAIILLSLAVLFHLAILSVSGIFFWMWIVVDGALALQIARLSDDEVTPLFARPMFVTSLVLIPLVTWWLQPVGLSWLDAPVSYTYRLEGISPDGRRYALPPAVFAPYRYEFTLGRLSHYAPRPVLDITWGAARLDTARALKGVMSPSQVVEVERRLARRQFDSQRALVTDDFVRQWLIRLHERGHARVVPGPLRAPPQLLTFSPSNRYRGDVALCRVEVRLVTSLFDGTRYLEFRDEVVRSITVSRSGRCA